MSASHPMGIYRQGALMLTICANCKPPSAARLTGSQPYGRCDACGELDDAEHDPADIYNPTT